MLFILHITIKHILQWMLNFVVSRFSLSSKSSTQFISPMEASMGSPVVPASRSQPSSLHKVLPHCSDRCPRYGWTSSFYPLQVRHLLFGFEVLYIPSSSLPEGPQDMLYILDNIVPSSSSSPVVYVSTHQKSDCIVCLVDREGKLV